MREGTANLMAMFYPPWSPPDPEIVTTRRHRLLDDSKTPRKEPVQARTKIMAALHKFNWMTIEEIARETCVTVETVSVTTDRMYRSGTIERSKRSTPHGKVNLYRKK